MSQAIGSAVDVDHRAVIEEVQEGGGQDFVTDQYIQTLADALIAVMMGGVERTR